MRTESSIKNLLYSLGGQGVTLLLKLISRFIFVRILTSEYLGLNGLFSNILSLLSLVELGIGPAMVYSLYKPLAKNDREKIKSLMRVYRIAYNIIGTIILIVGVCITPFLSFFIKDMPDIQNIELIYFLFVLNSSISYFYVYKKSLIEADQKRYISTLYHSIFSILLTFMQTIVLIITHNYIAYLITQVIITILENIAISMKANKLHPYIKEKNIKKLDEKEVKSLTKNISAMVFHKIGSVVVTVTDNLIISKFIGLVEVGIYSNYLVIINALKSILNQIFTSITASIGNLVVLESEKKTYDVFKKVLFLNFWIYSFVSICLVVLFNDFITIWVGKGYLFNMSVVTIITINFYITGMRKTVLTFRDALGLYWQDRYKPICEALINIIASILLVKYFGIIGVFVGTFISTILTCFWVEPYILFKYGIKQKVKNYFKTILKYSVVTVLMALITYFICSFVSMSTLILTFIVKIIICLIVPNVCYILLFRTKEEFKYFVKMLIDIFYKIKNRKVK